MGYFYRCKKDRFAARWEPYGPVHKRLLVKSNHICRLCISVISVSMLSCATAILVAAITTFAGIGLNGGYSGDGGVATSAKFSDPNGVAIGSSGDVYVADNKNEVVRKVIPVNVGKMCRLPVLSIPSS